jgi:uncharacterized glyoxalase superfamily protein PhnB
MARSKTRTKTPKSVAAPLGCVLLVADIARASRFYEKLGFTQQAAYPRADGELTVALLSHGGSTLILGRRDELHYENPARARLIRKGPIGLGTVLTCAVPDLDAVYRAVKRAKVQILLEPTEEFYGDRVFFFLDPDGYEWKISETVRQVDSDEVAGIIAQHRP